VRVFADEDRRGGETLAKALNEHASKPFSVAGAPLAVAEIFVTVEKVCVASFSSISSLRD
jgi:hypothetical protein